ncbi:DMT family transporter [Pseudactinotalea sp. Z1739]|uniref:DMT family transporter n=1 Tax=Pseudactinotalea sp. Z1739 TaxID=3413028 RepID=UPI003C7A8287
MATFTDTPAPTVPAAATSAAPATPAPRPPASSRRPNRALGLIAIFASTTAMGTAGVFGRLSSPPGEVMGEALTMGRMLVGALGILVLLTITGRRHLLRQTRLSPAVVLGGVFLGLSFALMLSATVLTDLALAVALLYLGPVLATILARVVLKESPTRAETFSLAAAFTGMMLVAGLIEGPTTASENHLLGVLLGVASGVLYGAALLCYRFRADMPADVRSFWNFTFGTLATGAMVALTRPDLSAMTPANWAWALTFFAVCGLLALGLLVLAGKHLRTAELSRTSYWEVVVALLLGAALFGETISALNWAGVAIIVAAAGLPLLRVRRGVR